MERAATLAFKGLLLGASAFALCVLLAAGLRYARALLAGRRHAARVRKALGAPVAILDPSLDGLEVTLVGELVVLGAPRSRPDDEAPAAVVTIALSKRRLWFVEPKLGQELSFRATELALKLGQQRVRLEGPILLRVGSREWWPGCALRRVSARVQERLPEREVLTQGWEAMGRDVGVFRSVASGQRVLVRGQAHKLEDEAGNEGTSYRQGAVRMGLRPLPSEAGLVMAASASPRLATPLRRLLLTPVSTLCGLALGGFVSIQGIRYLDMKLDCEVAQGCRWAGLCQAQFTGGLGLACAAGSSADCDRSDACKREGQCSLRQGHCVAATNDDCLRSARCATAGACSASAELCLALTDADCARSDWCRDAGHCRAERGMCQVSEASACVQTPQCTLQGRCTRQAGVCIVGTVDDCAESAGCKELGWCSADLNLGPERRRCMVMGNADCARARVCLARGQCTANEEKCTATSAADCQPSANCKDLGMCQLKEGHCVRADRKNPCRDTNVCAQSGHCAPDGEHCIVAEDADCRASQRCTAEGRCYAAAGECIAKDDRDCESAEVCRMSGDCKASGIGGCVVSRDP